MAKKRQTQYSGIGGQAVLEGVMMKNKSKYAVAVRKPDGDIDVQVEEYKGVCGEKLLQTSADTWGFCFYRLPYSWNEGDNALGIFL